MKIRILSFIAALIGLVLSGYSEEAVRVDVTTTPAFKAFLTNYVTAINSKDPARLNECLYPRWVALMAKDQKFTEKWFKDRFTYAIPAEFKATAIPPGKPLPFANQGIVWPVKPTYQVQIEFKPTATNIAVMVLWVVSENDKWYEVLPSAPNKD